MSHKNMGIRVSTAWIDFAQWTFLMLTAVVWLYPLYYAVLNSFQMDKDIIAPDRSVLLIRHFTLFNYVYLINKSDLLIWIANSVITAAGTTVGVCAVSSLAGYAFAKIDFPGRNAIFAVIVSTMFLPGYVLITPLFRFIIRARWLDTYAALIVPNLAAPFGVFLMRQFITTLPSELIDAARIDGASEVRVFTRVVLRLSGSAVGALAIFTFMAEWKNLFWQLVVVSKREMRTLQAGLLYFNEDVYSPYGPRLAAATISVGFMVVVYLVFQRYFTRGVTTGAVKG